MTTRRAFVIIAIIIILLAVLLAVLFYTRYAGTPVVTNSYIPGVDAHKTVLLKKATISFPQVSSETKIDTTQLPLLLKNLIPSNSSDINATAVVYADKRAGYHVTFTDPRPLEQSHQDTDKIIGSKKISAHWTSLASLIEWRDKQSEGAVLQLLLDTGRSSASITTIILPLK